MAWIEVREVQKNNIGSCNNCSAINFDGCASYGARRVDKLYKLQISNSIICLCEDCLKELYDEISGVLDNHATEREAQK